ncbi:MAG: pyridoxamine 5'-phosphate oxidase family protein [Bacteroidetes bacterium]|nr:pyridoxamine 5'-phosphate oxidase family protein [Bacteroidota bacterium]
MKIENENQLRELYSLPSGRARDKVFTTLDKHAINFISKSPFIVLSTCDKNGKMDASPRGGNFGFVKVLNNKEIIIPDAKGNNRIDSLINILETGQIGMLFLIPGIDETLRINGSAFITTEVKYLEMFSSENLPPKTCMVINVEEVFLHCAKALMRSKLWNVDSKIERSELPTIGEMLKDQLGSKEPAETQDDMLKRYQKDL